MDYATLFRALDDHHVEFIVVGGVAATLHGSARNTEDLDVVYRRTRANIRRLVKAVGVLRPYLRGAPPGLPFEWSVAVVEAGCNFTLSSTAGPIDLLGEIVGGGTYDALLPHTMTFALFGHDIMVLDLPWLIRVKRAAGRRKDLEAVAELEVLRDERDA